MKKSNRRIASALLSMVVAATSLPMNVLGMPMVRLTQDESGGGDTQMVSDKTLVYVSTYDGTVRSQNFNENWKFLLGDAGNAQEISFDDSRWRDITLPHDYSIEQGYSPNMEAESGYLPGGIGWYRKNFTVPTSTANKQIRVDFDGVYMDATIYINGKEIGNHPYGYSPFSFDLTPYLNFGGDNVIAVKVNHQTPSSRWYSGSGIYRDVKLTITPMVHETVYGTKISTPNLESSHSGNVDVHAETSVKNEFMEDKEVSISYSLYKKDDETKTPVGTGAAETVSIPGGTESTVTADFTVDSPELWTVDDPELYVVETTIDFGEGVPDVTESDFGFRYFDFDTQEGFALNGEPMKLKGVCLHHDQGSLGAAAYERAIERQVEILQDMGCNAIRVTHNPAAKALIDVCNEKGMLVIEEMFDGWHGQKNGNSKDYARFYGQQIPAGNQILGNTGSMTWAEFDLRSTIRRSYNAPSVISWSLGNEVMEGISIGIGDYANQGRKLLAWAKDEDSTRPITFGDNKLKQGNGQSVEIGNALAAAGGTVGFNYTTLDQLDGFHRDHPDWPIYGSETASSINSRGVYNPGLYDRQMTAYDEGKVGWGHYASQAWFDTIRKDYVAGEFVWTGFDYIGEPTNWNGIGSGAVGNWPSPKNSYFGIIDTAGFPKDSYYLYRSMWNEEDHTVHILPAWNESVVAKNGSNQVKVVVYSDAKDVELFFTPKGSEEKQSLGKKSFTELHSKKDDGSDGEYTYQMYLENDTDAARNDYRNLYRTWMVPYADGTLTAVAVDADGNTIEGAGRSMVTTAGDAAALKAEVDRDTIMADGKDLAYISVDVTDENGNLVPDADNRVTFKVEGDGELVGVDNGWTTDHDSYQIDNRRAFNGKVLAIVRSTKEAGEFTVTASAQGLASSSVSISTEETDEKETVPDNGIVSYEISKNYYVKVGNKPELPDTLTVYMADGTSEELPVEWKTIDQEKLESPGSFVLTGDMNGTTVSVSISMIEGAAAILNYSTTVHVGEMPILPESRQIVGEDGNILNIAIPVVWDEKDESEYSHPGIVDVEGTAFVFGEALDVKASVRVQEEVLSITDNVASKAVVEQTVGTASDTLSAIINGSTASTEEQDSQWRNLSRWSNWDYTKNNDNDPPATIGFTYATQESLGQAKIYFVRNNVDLRTPDEGATKWYISNDMEEWIPLETRETIGEESNFVTCYTYDFAPVKATYLKLEIHNSTEKAVPNGKKATTGITEVELYRSEGRFTAYGDTGLSALTINGIEIAEGQLTGDAYDTPMTVVEDITAAGKNNAAVTVLPAYEDKVIVITEAEDHSKRENFVINLGAESSFGPDDASMDYPVGDMTVDSFSSQEIEGDPGAATNVLDGNPSSFWHSKWVGNYTDTERWIILKLDEETKLDALRYLPRQNAANGRINTYRVEVSSDKSDWTTVAEGNWNSDTSWKMAEFDTPTAATYVRLTGVVTDGGQNKFITAAEIRVRVARETVDLTEDGDVTLDEDIYYMDESGEPVIPEISVSVNGEKLKYGIDYTLTYENNDKPGTAAVVIKGIMKYSGIIRKEFRIISQTSQTITVVNGTVTAVEGEEYTGGSEAQAESGTAVTVKAEPEEGMVFDHWRSTPENLLTTVQKTEEEITFMVPDSSVRLTAVCREEGTSHLKKEVYSVAHPSDWFAYADEEGLEEVLDSAMENSDHTALARGGSIALKMDIEYSKDAFSKKDIIKSYNLATPSEAGAYYSVEKATPSEGEGLYRPKKATPSESEESSETKNPYDILNKEIPAPLQALKEALGLGGDDKEVKKSTKISFWMRTTTTKTTNGGGQPVSVLLTDTSLPTVEIVAELPKKDRNMADYIVYSYEFDGDGFMFTEINGTSDGKNLTFEGSVDGIYAVSYTQCYDVIFEDWDGTVLSRQRVPYGEAAVAPEDPEREGYTFIGWSKDFDEITKNLKIRAQYEKGTTDKPEEGDKADKRKLEKKIEEIHTKLEFLDQEDYTEKSWSALQDVLEKAEGILEDEDASQKEVDKILEKLVKAYAGLEKKPEETVKTDRKKLEAKVKEVRGALETAEQKDYTEKSWNALLTALEKAEGILEDEKASQKEIDKALGELTKAYAALEKNSQTPQRPSHSGGGGSGVSSGTGSSVKAPIPLDGGRYVTKGTWKEESGKWSFVKSTGEKAVDGWIYALNGDAYDWFYFDKNGIMADGWLTLDGNTFYLNPVSDGKRGKMMTGWQKIDEKWYYFSNISDGTRGKLLKDTKTPDGYLVDKDGVWK